MALNLNLGDAHVNAQADALNALYNGGKMRIYGGVQPAICDTPTAEVVLVEYALPTPCFGAAVAGVLAANTIADVVAAGSGTATWYRVVAADGATGLQDGSVGTAGCNLNMDAVTIVAGVTQHISSWGHTVTK